MIATTNSFTLSGIHATPLTVECDMTNGLPSISIIGLSAKIGDGTKERVRSAITNSGLEFPRKRITINLAPAGDAIDSPMYDLPIAMAILCRSGQIENKRLANTYLVGELGLDGTMRPVRGIISMAQKTLSEGSLIIGPNSSAEQLDLIKGCQMLTAKSLLDVYTVLTSDASLLSFASTSQGSYLPADIHAVDFRDILAQSSAKRALEISAAGGHNILLTGPPGTGKSMLAKALPGILPPMSPDEMMAVTQLHSLASNNFEEVIHSRPFRSPHHSASHIALVGGGQTARPGEISLSHAGVLLLDEVAEFSKQSLELLRQPIEDGCIRISRASKSVEYPANFILVATMNPCPCGYYGDRARACQCTLNEVVTYQKKLSGPILDRIDMTIAVERLEPNSLAVTSSNGESSKSIQKRVIAARSKQYERLGDANTNSQMSSTYIRQNNTLSKEAKRLLIEAIEKLQLSPRTYFRIVRVAQTIADLASSDEISPAHMAEALHFRTTESRFVSTTSLTPGA